MGDGTLAAIVVGTVLANNFVLTKFLGLCPFLGASNRMESALGMSLATAFVLTIACALGALVESRILEPFGLSHLRVLALILIIASVVQLTEVLMRGISPLLYRLLGIFLPLITTNCAVLGVALFNLREGYGFLQAALYGLFTAVGFALVLVCFAAMRTRLETADVPGPFRGAPVALAAAALMALAFQGFQGLGGAW